MSSNFGDCVCSTLEAYHIPSYRNLRKFTIACSNMLMGNRIYLTGLEIMYVSIV